MAHSGAGPRLQPLAMSQQDLCLAGTAPLDSSAVQSCAVQ